MGDRHFFSDHSTLVLRSLTGLANTQPNLSVIPSIKTVINADHDDSKVTLICGGGSGHEPGSTGFVGRGLLSASVCGDVFASPSARQVYGAMKALPSKKGTILIITNCCVFALSMRCFELTMEPQIRATTCISVLRVSRRGRMESKMSIFFRFATMFLSRDLRVLSSVDVRWRAQSSVCQHISFCVAPFRVFCFFLFFQSIKNHRRCFRSRLVFRRCPQTWPSRHRSHRFDSLHARPLPRPRTLRILRYPP